MRLIELNVIEFGCLKDKRVSLSEGINVIEGDNESGKSTLMLFIRFMLYGLPKKSQKSFERDRSLSFDGHRAAGSLTVESEGRLYKIERQVVATGRANETLKITDLTTGETLDGEPGEVFLGVPCEVFENSCGISQSKAAEINKAQAASAIENMLASADESIDVKKVLDRIDAVRKEYKLNKGEGGIIHRTESEISELRTLLRGATEKQLSINDMGARLSKKEQDVLRVKDELAEAEKALEISRNQSILKRFDALESKKQQLESKKAELSELVESVTVGDFVPTLEHVASFSAAVERFESARGRYAEREAELTRATEAAQSRDELASVGERIEAAGGKEKVIARLSAYRKSKTLKAVLGAMLIAVGAVTGVIAAVAFAAMVVRASIAAVAVIAAALGICMFIASSKDGKKTKALCDEYGKPYGELEAYLSLCVERLRCCRVLDGEAVAAKSKLDVAREELSEAEARLNGLLALTGGADAGREIARLETFCRDKERAEREIYALRALVESESRALSEYDESGLRVAMAVPALPLDAAERAVSFNKAKREALERETGVLRETLAALKGSVRKDPVELSDRISELENRLERHEQYFEALMLAKHAIEQASVSMSGNVTPEISRRAGEMLALISDGKHASLQTTKSLEMSVEQDGFGMRAELLSGGTRDAAYICLRIALMMRLFGERLPPLIMDEAMCHMDDKRVGILLGLLGKLSDIELQILIFTCHSREAEICAQKGIKTNLIKL